MFWFRTIDKWHILIVRNGFGDEIILIQFICGTAHSLQGNMLFQIEFGTCRVQNMN